MNTTDLQAIASRTRFMREAGIALILGSLALSAFLFIPLAPGQTAAVATAPIASTTPDAFADIALTAKSAVVYDLTTGKVLYGKNEDAQLPLASLTKLLTTYAAVSTLGPDEIITIPADAEKVDMPHAFNVDQQFSLSDLARVTLTASLNDGAVALADAAAAQTNQSISSLFSGVASKLGLAETYAVNGSGLDQNAAVSGGYGSAHDVALLAGALVALAPDIALATTNSSAVAISKGGTKITAKNTNPDVLHVPRLLLSKTGFTDLAGGNLALVFDAGIGHPIAIVVLGSTETERFTDGQTLIGATLAHFASQP